MAIAAAHGIECGRFFAPHFVETLAAISRPYIKLRLSFLLSIVSASMGQISCNADYFETEMAGISNEINKSSVNSQGLRWRLLFSRNETKNGPQKVTCAAAIVDSDLQWLRRSVYDPNNVRSVR